MGAETNNKTGLAARYREAFATAWAHRHAWAKRDYTAAEAQFLPAALALQESPAPAAPRVAMWLMIGFAAMTLMWAVFGRIDIVATAPGKIVPNDRSKVIQSVDTATVLAIHVSDGQAVKAGDPLIDLDATDASADADKVTGERSASLLQVARGEALLAALDANRRPVLGAVEGASEAQLLEARRQLSSLFDEHNTKLARMNAEIERRQAELQSTRHMVERLEQTAPIAARRAADFKDLMEKNFVSKHGFLEREQARIEQEGELAVQRNRLRELDAALRESRQQRAAQIAELKRTTLDSIREGQQRADALTQDQVKADNKARLMKLNAPVDGTVQQLAIHTLGGVVTAAQPIMVVVPADASVEIEVQLENRDIGFVTAGQAVEIKVDTFPFTKYGTVPGRVVSVSQDAANDEKRGLVYPALIKLERGTIRVGEKDVRLSSGMAVTAEIKTGKRRVIEYFLSPLMEYASDSLKER